MKNLSYLFVLGISVLLISCSPTKDVTTSDASTTATTTSTAANGPRGQRPDRGRGERPELTDEQKAMMEARREEARKKREAMLASLELTEEQRGKLDAINNKYQEQFRDFRKNNEGDRETMRETMIAMRNRQQVEIQGVLSEEQYEVYNKFMQENRRGGKNGGMRPERGERPERGPRNN